MTGSVSGASVQARYAAVCAQIPGMQELAAADSDYRLNELVQRYPNAAFAHMLAGAMWQHKDAELGDIYGRAYTAILNGQNPGSVRCRYEKDMDAYVSRHMWDD